MSEPLISFVVLSYNYARFIGETITSILAQSGDHEIEIIVVDDASTDDSDAVIRSFADPRVRYLRHERNQGHAATVTDGLRVARGDLIARIDSDDRYRPNFLDTMVPLFGAHPEIGLAYGDAAVIDDAGAVTASHVDNVHGGRDFAGNEYVALLERNFICAPTIIARREAWLSALPIPRWLVFHDWYFTLMIARRWPCYFTSEVVADYRVHQANYHTRISREKTEEESVMRLLELLFSTQETTPQLQADKLAARDRILGSHYLQLAQKYFWFSANADARRCFWQAIQHRPQYLARPDVVRQFGATLIGRGAYERFKRVVKSR